MDILQDFAGAILEAIHDDCPGGNYESVTVTNSMADYNIEQSSDLVSSQGSLERYLVCEESA